MSERSSVGTSRGMRVHAPDVGLLTEGQTEVSPASLADAVPQHMSALAKGNAIRIERAAIKARLHALPYQGSRSAAAELILDPPPALANMPVCDLLCACRRAGVDFVRRTLRSLQIGERRPIGELTDRQRAALAGRLIGGQS